MAGSKSTKSSAASSGRSSSAGDSGSSAETITTSSGSILATDLRAVGWKWFESVLIEQAMHESRGLPHLSVATLLEQKTSSFDYGKGYRMIRSQVNIGVGKELQAKFDSMPETYLIAAGLIRFSGSDAMKEVLFSSAQGNPAGPSEPRNTSRRSSISSQDSAATLDSGFFEDASNEDLPLYSMALNEHTCGANEYLPAVRYSLDPPLWTVVVKVDDAKWTGQGRNKKTARLQAAKRACIALGISVV